MDGNHYNVSIAARWASGLKYITQVYTGTYFHFKKTTHTLFDTYGMIQPKDRKYLN